MKRKRSNTEDRISKKAKLNEKELPEFRLVTVRQPWAEALLKGIKKIENRSYPLPPWLHNCWLALHVSSTYGRFEKDIPTWRGRSSDSDLTETCGKIIGLIRFSSSVNSTVASKLDSYFTDYPVWAKHHWVRDRTIVLPEMIPSLSNVRFPRITDMNIRRKLGKILEDNGEVQPWIPIPKEGDKHFCIHCGLSFSKKPTLMKHIKNACEWTGPVEDKRKAIHNVFLSRSF